MNKKYFFSLVGIYLHISIQPIESQNLLPSGWNTDHYNNYLEKIKTISTEFELSTQELAVWTPTLESSHATTLDSHNARNNKLDHIAQTLVTLFNCIPKCNDTYNALYSQYENITNQIIEDQITLQEKIDEIIIDIAYLNNLLSTIDESTNISKIEEILTDLDRAKNKCEEQIVQRDILATKLTNLKSLIDAMNNDDYTTQIKNELISNIDLECTIRNSDLTFNIEEPELHSETNQVSTSEITTNQISLEEFTNMLSEVTDYSDTWNDAQQRNISILEEINTSSIFIQAQHLLSQDEISDEDIMAISENIPFILNAIDPLIKTGLDKTVHDGVNATSTTYINKREAISSTIKDVIEYDLKSQVENRKITSEIAKISTGTLSLSTFTEITSSCYLHNDIWPDALFRNKTIISYLQESSKLKTIKTMLNNKNITQCDISKFKKNISIIFYQINKRIKDALDKSAIQGTSIWEKTYRKKRNEACKAIRQCLIKYLRNQADKLIIIRNRNCTIT